MKRVGLGCILSATLAMFGCAHQPSARITTPSGATLRQAGPAEIPAHVETLTTTAALPIPAGSVVTVTNQAVTPTAASQIEKSRVTARAPQSAGGSRDATCVTAPGPVTAWSVTLAKDTTATVTTRTERAEAPRAFAPPAPPTPAEKAQGDGVRMFYLAALVAAVVGGLLVWREHVLAGVCVAAGGLSLPILARFYTSRVALPVSASLVAAGVVFWLAWHLIESRRKASLDPVTVGEAEIERLDSSRHL